MDDLVQWLRAQLDEDERIARTACEYASPEWRLDEETSETVLWWPPEPHVAEQERKHGLPVVSDQWRGMTIDAGGARLAPHIARHDPARVLREIDAKREVLRLAERAHDYHETFLNGFAAAMEGALRLFALAYADRPGYRDEWRP